MTRTAAVTALFFLHLTCAAAYADPVSSRADGNLASAAPRQTLTAPPAALNSNCCGLFEDPESKEALHALGIGVALVFLVATIIV